MKETILKTVAVVALVVSVAALAFALGWFMRGDLIYSSMFSGYASMMSQVK